MRTELPTRLLECLRYKVQLRSVTVDDGCCRDSQVLEHLCEAPKPTAVTVVPPAFVGHLRNRLQVRLDARTAKTWHKDLDVHDRDHEDTGPAAPASLDLLPAHAMSIALDAHRGLHGRRSVHQAVLVHEGARVRELQREVPVVPQAQLEAIAVVHWRGLAHGGQRRDYLLRVQDEAGDRWAARNWEVVPCALAQDDAATGRDNVGPDSVRVRHRAVLFVEVLAVVRGLPQDEEPWVLAQDHKALGHLHVPLQPCD
mmetsp:Transcript_66072/g.182953  ORF Transcript_66072/g.182953 Transcript_66072/m.182953 type:complete len:255 (+) Transcript_66072:602-1366(+)